MYLFPKSKAFLIVTGSFSDEVGLRAFVRSVDLHQTGHFMMGTANVGHHYFTVSGAFGADGLPMDLPKHVFDAGVEIPAEIRKFWATRGDGHNSAGSERKPLTEWAEQNMKLLRKAGQDLPSNAVERLTWAFKDNEFSAWAYRKIPTPKPVPGEEDRHFELIRSANESRPRTLAEAAYAAMVDHGVNPDQIAHHPYRWARRWVARDCGDPNWITS